MLFIAVSIQAQDLPDLRERTSDSLVGLANDSVDKSVELADFNNDGLEDLIISRHGLPAVLLINEDGVLVNRTDRWLTNTRHDNSNYAEAFDANGDDLTDVVFARLGAREPRLYRNLGHDDTGAWLGFDSGVDIEGASNALLIESGDVDADGTADLFIIQVELATNRLLLNDGNGNFTDASDRLGELGALQRGHAALLADVDSDADIDIVYIEGDLFLHVYYNDAGYYSNALRQTFQNDDGFAYIFGAADFNGDGVFDYRQYSNIAPLAQMSTGLTNSSGLPIYLSRQDAQMQSGNRKHGFVHMRDFDGDGDSDYVFSSMLRNFGGLSNTFEGMRTEVVINAGLNSGTFLTYTGEDWGRDESMDVKIIDVNDDGNMDLFVAHQNRYAVYLSNAPSKRVEIQSLQAAPQVAGLVSQFSASMTNEADFSYEWDFGDGTLVSSTDPEVEYVYSEPGRYLVTLTARGEQGSDSLSFRHHVHRPLLEQQSVSSSSIAVEQRVAAGNRVWVVNPDNNSVSVLDAETGSLLEEIPVGANPRALAIANNRVLVTGKSDATVTVLDTESLSEIDRLQLKAGSAPHGIVSDGPVFYVVLQDSGEVLKIGIDDLVIQQRLAVGPQPRHIAVSADGNQLLLPRFITSPVAGESTRSVATAGGAEVMLLGTTPLAIQATVVLPYNNIEDTDVSARGVLNYLTAPAIAPSGDRVIIGAKLDNIYRGSMRDGNAREHNMLVRGMIATLEPAAARENVSARFDFDNNSPPTAVVFGPSGNLLFVVHEASRLLEVMDVERMEVIYSTEVGFAPQGLALSAVDNRLFVDNYLSRQVATFDLSDLLQGRSDNLVLVQATNTVQNEVLPSQVLEGKRLFHDSANSALSAQKYISCATCHSEMGHDGRVWDFSDAGEGLRNTIDLRGRAGTAHGNIHWSANFDEIHDFENDIREVFDGTGLMEDADYERTLGTLDADNPKAGESEALDALASFTATLTAFSNSPHRSTNGELTVAGRRGKAVFRKLNCAVCHSGDEFTDSPRQRFHNIGTVDVDTGNRLGQPLPAGGLDTPTLRGLWHGAPYLHDGSALTLRDAVISHRALTGNLAVLANAREVDDLVSYLLQIDDREPRATSALDNDGDLLLNELDDDDDNDGTVDENDSFPFDAAETSDNDGDGIGDNRDLDDDNDGISDENENAGNPANDSDADGVLNRFDLDSDNDGLTDVLEATGIDIGLDGIRDSKASVVVPDSDGDGLSDEMDIESQNPLNDGAGPLDINTGRFASFDTNGDGRVDQLDDGMTDTNGDGVDDRMLLQGVVDVTGGCSLRRSGAGQHESFDPSLLMLLAIAIFSLSIRRSNRGRYRALCVSANQAIT